MSGPTLFWVMLLGGLVTFLIRLSFIALEGRYVAPAAFKRALPLVPVAALSALVVPELLLDQGALGGIDNPRLLAGAVAMLVAWRWKNATLTIIAGFVALFALG